MTDFVLCILTGWDDYIIAAAMVLTIIEAALTI